MSTTSKEHPKFSRMKTSKVYSQKAQLKLRSQLTTLLTKTWKNLSESFLKKSEREKDPQTGEETIDLTTGTTKTVETAPERDKVKTET